MTKRRASTRLVCQVLYAAKSDTDCGMPEADSPKLTKPSTWWTGFVAAEPAGPQYSLGQPLAAKHDPPHQADARTSYTRAAEAGNVDAQIRLGLLLAKLDPPELTEARTW